MPKHAQSLPAQPDNHGVCVYTHVCVCVRVCVCARSSWNSMLGFVVMCLYELLQHPHFDLYLRPRDLYLLSTFPLHAHTLISTCTHTLISTCTHVISTFSLPSLYLHTLISTSTHTLSLPAHT